MTSTNWALQTLFSQNSLLKVLLFSTYFCTVINVAGADNNENPTHKVYITTGDRKSNGAAWSSINFDLVMTDSTGRKSRIQSLVADHRSVRKGQTEQYDLVLHDAEYIKSITVKRTDAIESQDWFIDLVKIDYLDVENEEDDDLIIYSSYFPIHRWLHHTDEITISEYDSVLPQDDENPDERSAALRRKREMYRYSEKVHGAPPMVEILPEDEKFSLQYMNYVLSETAQFVGALHAAANNTPHFESLSDIEQLYRGDNFHVPERMTDWAEDVEFGRQRLTGINPSLIKICTKLPKLMEKAIEDIEQNFPSGTTLADSVKNKRVYMIDLSYMANIESAEPIPGAVGLFHVADNGDLMPIAIQLTPDEDAPVFTPQDSHYTWMAAKMWFNNADGSHHQAASHLGLTHMVIESVGVATHRQLSQSHPVFRLLAPHLRYIMHVNWLALQSLINVGGNVDQTMRMGRHGMLNIIKDRYSEWSLQSDGNFMKNLKHRGVQNVTTLPGYHYRDDGKLLWVALQKYVQKSISSYYGQGNKGNERLLQDNELQGWINELVCDSVIKGMPVKHGNDTYYVEKIDDLVEIVTTFVFISTVQHAAVNYQQYDSYGFIPNNPIALRGDWPRSKAELTEKDVVNMLPSKEQTIKIMTLVTQLSIHGTERLGDFEVQYAYDPASLSAAQELRDELRDIESKLAQKNKKRKDKYRYLMPRYMPNCINI